MAHADNELGRLLARRDHLKDQLTKGEAALAALEAREEDLARQSETLLAQRAAVRDLKELADAIPSARKGGTISEAQATRDLVAALQQSRGLIGDDNWTDGLISIAAAHLRKLEGVQQ